MQRDPRTELTYQWVVSASEDLDLADPATQASPPLLSGALYHCQQAFEKTLKAFLAWHLRPLQRTHSLPELLKLCVQIDHSFSSLAAEAALVTPYATQFRYPPVPAPAKMTDAQDALRAARSALAFALQRLPSATHP